MPSFGAISEHSISSVTIKRTVSISLDVLVQKALSSSTSIDVQIAETIANTLGVDAIVGLRFTTTSSIDALIQKALSENVSLDVLVKKALSQGISLDTLIQDTFSQNFSVDTLVQKAFLKSISVDAQIAETIANTTSLDAKFGTNISKTASFDAVLEYTYYEMWDYLSTVSPDSDVTLDIKPTQTLVEEGAMAVVIHLGDDGSEERVALDEESVFYVSLQWSPKNETDTGTIMDFFNSTSKGCGMAKSFKWVNYGEPEARRHIYVVRFATDLSRTVKKGYIYGISNVRLEVLGRV